MGLCEGLGLFIAVSSPEELLIARVEGDGQCLLLAAACGWGGGGCHSAPGDTRGWYPSPHPGCGTRATVFWSAAEPGVCIHLGQQAGGTPGYSPHPTLPRGHSAATLTLRMGWWACELAAAGPPGWRGMLKPGPPYLVLRLQRGEGVRKRCGDLTATARSGFKRGWPCRPPNLPLAGQPGVPEVNR